MRGFALSRLKPLLRYSGAAQCGRASGELFVGGRRPWCKPDLSTGEEIRDVLLRCPTGALTASFADGSVVEPAVEENQITVTQNGPLYLSGTLDIKDAPDDMPGTRFRAALCRCDGSHKQAGFKSS
jgi:hypothetical protein